MAEDHDVAKPILNWIQDKCYRVNPSRNDYGIQNTNTTVDACGTSNTISAPPSSATLPYREHDDMTGCDPDEGTAEDDGVEFVVEQVSGRFSTRAEIPNALYAVVIGPKGSVKKRIEVETNTTITIPRLNEQGDIVIRGKKREDVVRARRRMESIASQGRFRREATHFLCFPLNSQTLVQNAHEFKKKVLSDFKAEGLGIDEKVFQEPEKIHLTLCVVMFLDQAERQKGMDTLEKLKPRILEMTSKANLRCRVQGLEIMNDDPAAVNILFAKCVFPEGDTTVQALADFIHQEFIATGLAKASRSDSVKLHVTLMNTRYRQQELTRSEAGDGNGNRGRSHFEKKADTFNAKPILDKYPDYDFGFVEIKEIHISTRHTKGPDGFYKPSAKLRLKD